MARAEMLTPNFAFMLSLQEGSFREQRECLGMLKPLLNDMGACARWCDFNGNGRTTYEYLERDRLLIQAKLENFRVTYI
jgi:hypothetical protein